MHNTFFSFGSDVNIIWSDVAGTCPMKILLAVGNDNRMNQIFETIIAGGHTTDFLPR